MAYCKHRSALLLFDIECNTAACLVGGWRNHAPPIGVLLRQKNVHPVNLGNPPRYIELFSRLGQFFVALPDVVGHGGLDVAVVEEMLDCVDGCPRLCVQGGEGSSQVVRGQSGQSSRLDDLVPLFSLPGAEYRGFFVPTHKG